ncbi:hypothetical protein D7Y09_01875 [bacterium 1XD42-1]|nr:hypothetical protein D7X25_00920 [bacterium 1XD42-8]RKJ67344.1 hypothetical protein D7Y09_01875 [bacterium 1XD42-1]
MKNLTDPSKAPGLEKALVIGVICKRNRKIHVFATILTKKQPNFNAEDMNFSSWPVKPHEKPKTQDIVVVKGLRHKK